MHSHSFRSFTLLGDPIARLDIRSTFEGFNSVEVACSVSRMLLISKKGGIYQMNLKKK